MWCTLPGTHSFNTANMTGYQHLTNLDFVSNATSPQSNFGCIPLADMLYPHLQLFYRLTTEFFKNGRLRESSSDNHFALFNAPNLLEGLEAHKKMVDPWFVNLHNLNFTTTVNVIDYLQAGTRVEFVYKVS